MVCPLLTSRELEKLTSINLSFPLIILKVSIRSPLILLSPIAAVSCLMNELKAKILTAFQKPLTKYGTLMCKIGKFYTSLESGDIPQRYFRPALCFILVYNCGLTVRNKQICYVMQPSLIASSLVNKHFI